MERRVISTQMQEEDVKIEKTLRPQTLDGYIGQEKIKENLKVYIEAARQRNEALDHVLFYGPPGLERQHLQVLLQTKWEPILRLHLDQRFKNRGIWPQF